MRNQPLSSGDVVIIYRFPQRLDNSEGIAILLKKLATFNSGTLEQWQVAFLEQPEAKPTVRLVHWLQERLYWHPTERTNLYEVKV